MSPAHAWVRAGVVFAIVLAVDQVTKALVRGSLRPGEERSFLPALDLVHVRNEGVAFGISAGGPTLLVAIISVALLLLVLYFARHAGKPGMWLPTGLLLGGAIGNIVDRVHQGHVTDFLKIPAWPAFNVADIAITVGIVALVFVLERRGAPSGA